MRTGGQHGIKTSSCALFWCTFHSVSVGQHLQHTENHGSRTRKLELRHGGTQAGRGQVLQQEAPRRAGSRCCEGETAKNDCRRLFGGFRNLRPEYGAVCSATGACVDELGMARRQRDKVLIFMCNAKFRVPRAARNADGFEGWQKASRRWKTRRKWRVNCRRHLACCMFIHRLRSFVYHAGFPHQQRTQPFSGLTLEGHTSAWQTPARIAARKCLLRLKPPRSAAAGASAPRHVDTTLTCTPVLCNSEPPSGNGQ